MLCLRAACSQPAIGHQPSQSSRSALRYTYGDHSYNVHRFVIKSSLSTGKCVSGSVRVRVRAMARVSARVTVRDRDRI